MPTSAEALAGILESSSVVHESRGISHPPVYSPFRYPVPSARYRYLAAFFVLL